MKSDSIDTGTVLVAKRDSVKFVVNRIEQFDCGTEIIHFNNDKLTKGFVGLNFLDMHFTVATI
jgi:hypothetical protein